MNKTFDNFEAVEAESFSNFDTDFNYMVSPETTQQLAELGTKAAGKIIEGKAARNAMLSPFDVGLKTQCGNRPARIRKKKLGEYETCKTSYTTEFNKRADTTKATAEASALASSGANQTATEGMSTNMKIGIGVGAVVVLGAVLFLAKK